MLRSLNLQRLSTKQVGHCGQFPLSFSPFSVQLTVFEEASAGIKRSVGGKKVCAPQIDKQVGFALVNRSGKSGIVSAIMRFDLRNDAPCLLNRRTTNCRSRVERLGQGT